jgi:ribosomal protein S18 acetylase RimI-like enzyme
MFESLYEFMSSVGPVPPLIEGGAQLWWDSIAPTLGRFTRVIVATSDGNYVGFVQGMVRGLPSFQGGGIGGFVAHAYVNDINRRGGLGRQLYELVEAWFIEEQEVDEIELEVVCGNELGQAFWLSQGYVPQRVKMRKTIAA